MNGMQELKNKISEYLKENDFEQIKDHEYWLQSVHGSRYWKKGDVEVMNCPHPCGKVVISSKSNRVVYPRLELRKEDVFERIVETIEYYNDKDTEKIP